jgi:voltage-gated potassium channel
MKGDVTRDEIRAIPLFDGLSEAGVDRLLGAAAELAVSSGQVLALPGDHASGMFVVLDGSVTVERRHGAVDVGAGTFFGELALLVPDAERVARVRAAADARVLCIPRDDFLALVESEPALALALLRGLAARLHAAELER